MNKNYTLLIWEEVPESTSMYLIPNDVLQQNPEWDQLLMSTHNKFLNGTKEDVRGLRFVNAALTPEEHIDNDNYFDDGYTTTREGRVKTHEATPKEWRCVFAKYKRESDQPITDVTINRVILTGFIL